jgi:hypothetical protein
MARLYLILLEGKLPGEESFGISEDDITAKFCRFH